MSGSLCQYCWAFFPIGPERRGRVEYYKTARDFVAGTRHTSCPLCMLIRQQLRVAGGNDDDGGDAAELVMYFRDEQTREGDGDAARANISRATLMGNFRNHQHGRVVLSIATCPRSAPPIWERALEITTIPEKHAIVKSWLSECELHHERCRTSVPTGPRTLPRRLIKLGSVAGLATCRLVLSESEPLHESIEYAALSHCWGQTTHPLRTTRANLESLSTRIPTSATGQEGISLPRTFREAIDLCRSLGIWYLWIDSLCIVQDDAEEWATEAARMKDVYANAKLTVAVSDATNCDAGCFVNADSERGIDKVYCLAWDHQEVTRGDCIATATEGSRESRNLSIRIYEGLPGTRTMKANLSKRGWALQELILSRRVVHCTYPEMHWQCASVYQTEAGVVVPDDVFNHGHIRTSWSRPKRHLKDRFPDKLTDIEESSLVELVHESWCQWVENYSARKFTFWSDRLPALAGIVERFAEMSGYTHLLGSWAESIASDLAWSVANISESARERNLPGVPSWSWLAQAGSIDYLTARTYKTIGIPQIQGEVLLVRGNIAWDGVPLLSTLRHAELVLQGRLKWLNIYDPNGSGDALIVREPGGDSARADSGSGPPQAHGGFDKPSARGTRRDLQRTYPCLQLCSTIIKNWPGHEWLDAFLILELVPSSIGHGGASEHGCTRYKRLGIVGAHTSESFFYNTDVTTITLF
ncbi:heterokaryon incompatibility protein-domain-containing protein [Microdochium bolleyi]|uniref:Heterokaryon incompatibility protein-domain-containing protein n=1 Tax=Microdochium bolleyi TaxID=196109 RepID=A0A136IQ77_9PEZI|nr:heterokaryon incompatibility protein-domain-containing protein [Microdochium bolleyi]